MTNQVSFGQQQGGIKSAIGAVGSSALNVGVTVGAGAGVGALAGKLASLAPYTPSAADLNHQYHDMFIRAINSKETPEYMKEGADTLKGIVGDARKIFVKSKTHLKRLGQAGRIKGVCETAIEEIKADAKVASDESIQAYAKKLLKSKSEAPLSKEEVLGAFEKHIKKADKLIEKIKNGAPKEKLDTYLDDFVKKASESPKTKELAEKGAKHLRKCTMIGVGAAVGIIGALVINILRTNGILKLGRRKQASAQAPNNIPNPQIGTTQG